jgi:hypothetical protein
MTFSDYLSDLSPSQCLSELARLLARGVSRVRERSLVDGKTQSPPDPETLPESRAGGLDVCPEVRLTVHKGLREPPY